MHPDVEKNKELSVKKFSNEHNEIGYQSILELVLLNFTVALPDYLQPLDQKR